ncbi:GNAT family N-acetyltransferase [Aeromonas caviae]|uniref:GNAT family N-acetyltransferase n=1 Tax=Aeromonas caviae TaxID=648 RepID=UPI002B46EC81|nr:GNAT family N-acetyltransferase [Aeromonas caviae]
MDIIEDNNREMLKKIQSTLDSENKLKNDVGIADIWHTLGNPRYFIAIADNKPIAVATLHGYDEPELYKLYVIPSHRRKNVAKSLVEHVINNLSQNGINELFVEMTNGSLEFWDSIAMNHEIDLFDGDSKIIFKIQ